MVLVVLFSLVIFFTLQIEGQTCDRYVSPANYTTVLLDFDNFPPVLTICFAGMPLIIKIILTFSRNINIFTLLNGYLLIN